MSADLVRRAADHLRGGGIVAYPTDTFYGLAVDPASDAAVDALFALKGRDPRMAIPLLASSMAQVREWAGELPHATARLARAFWPGPLSLILDAPATVAPAVTGAMRTVAIRVPGHTIARDLAEAFGAPITSTSANRSGQPPVVAASDLAWMREDARVFVLDGGRTPGGAPSTIVDARGDAPVLVRAGAVAWERVLESLNT